VYRGDGIDRFLEHQQQRSGFIASTRRSKDARRKHTQDGTVMVHGTLGCMLIRGQSCFRRADNLS
jgi:hypothetical protein